MKIRFLKDYRYPGGGYSNKGDVQTFEDAEFAKWAIDNGFAEEVKESGWWKPKKNEAYYYESGVVTYCVWTDDESDENRFRIGNCFKTREAIEKWHDYLKANAIVRQDEGVLTPEQVVKDGYVYYICDNNEFGPLVYGSYVDCVSVNTILFDTREHAQASRDKHRDEWKIIANYDWSRE